VPASCLPSFTEISPSAIGACSPARPEVPVVKKPVVGIIPTGDEVVPPAADPREGEIPEFNGRSFRPCFAGGARRPSSFRLCGTSCPDQDAVSQALDTCDIVLLNAARRPDARITAPRPSARSEAFCTTAGHQARQAGHPRFIGGISRSSAFPDIRLRIIVIEELLRPLVAALTKRRSYDDDFEEAVLSKAVVSSLKYEEFIRVRLGYVQDRLIALSLSRGSGWSAPL
jgi:putative molybdopterin biosynthesis protein